jgi:hypothetical protein
MKTKAQLLLDYQVDLIEGKCVMKYFQYGFDLDFTCYCPTCERFDQARDIVDNKNKRVSAQTALRNNGFSDKEIVWSVGIFFELGIYTDKEINGCHLRIM